MMSAYTVYAASRNVLPLDKWDFSPAGRGAFAPSPRWLETTYYCQVVLYDPPMVLRHRSENRQWFGWRCR